jgi:ketosteroid isomerase-like protein
MTNAPAPSSDNAAVAQAVETFYQAVISKNQRQFDALTSAQLSFGHSVGRIENKVQFIANAMSPRTVWKAVNPVDQSIQVTGDTAVVRHIMAGENQREGEATPNTVKMGVLMVWQKQSGAWKLLARQAFKL